MLSCVFASQCDVCVLVTVNPAETIRDQRPELLHACSYGLMQRDACVR